MYDAREAVYGAWSINESREKMSLRLTGCDLNGNKVKKSVFECFSEYLQKDRYIFVGRNNSTNIKVDRNLWLVDDFANTKAFENLQNGWLTQAEYSYASPLTGERTKHLIDYCREKNITLWQFLFNEMGFNLISFSSGIGTKVPTQNEPSSGNYYLAADAQKYTEVKKVKDSLDIFGDDVKYYAYFDCANACKAGAEFEHKALRLMRKTDGKITANRRENVNMIFFWTPGVPYPAKMLSDLVDNYDVWPSMEW